MPHVSFRYSRAGGRRRLLAAALVGLGLLLHGGSAAAKELLVFAAASLSDAMDAAAATYMSEGGSRIVASYASSSTLARQIGQGAPADLFISANVQWMDYLAERELISATSRIDLLGNGLVLVAPQDSEIDLAVEPGFPLAAALEGQRLAIGDPDHVPAGQYAEAALRSLGVWESVADKLVRADNVRVALALVARGETPLGIVYRSDAVAEPAVRVVSAFPADSHPPIVYPAAIVAASGNPEAARFLEFLRTPDAGAIFDRFGFMMIE